MGKLFATIKVSIIHLDHGQKTTVTYNDIEFYIVPAYLQPTFLITLGVIVIIVLCLVLIVLAKKFRRVQKTLKVEMQDIRNIASVSAEEGRTAAQKMIEKIQYGEMNEEQL